VVAGVFEHEHLTVLEPGDGVGGDVADAVIGEEDVAAEDVAQGKPAPDCFELAASRLGVSARDCLIFEDAPAGIAAAEAAGASVVVITATHSHPLATPHLDVRDYAAFVPRVEADGRLRLAPIAG